MYVNDSRLTILYEYRFIMNENVKQKIQILFLNDETIYILKLYLRKKSDSKKMLRILFVE